MEQLWGASSPDVTGTKLPQLNTLFSYLVRSLLSLPFIANNAPCSDLTIVREGMNDPVESEWREAAHLEESSASATAGKSSQSNLSYVDFMCRMHGQIAHELSSSALAERAAVLSGFLHY